jgi:hypothetical protein
MTSVCGVLVVLVAAFAAVPSGAAGAANPNGPAIIVHYSGHFETQWPTSTSTSSPRGIPGDLARAELDWKAVGQITYSQLDDGVQVHWHYLKLFGTYDYTLLPSPGKKGLKCREVLTEVPGYETTADDAVSISAFAGGKYEVDAATPFNNRAVTTGKAKDDPCAAFAYWPEPTGTTAKAVAFMKAYQPSLMFARGKAVTMNWPEKTWYVPTQDGYDTVSATVTVSAAR